MEEAANLQFHRKLIEHNQAFLEGPQPTRMHQMPPFKSKLESHESENSQSPNNDDLSQVALASKDELFGQPRGYLGTKGFVEHESIPSLDEDLATQLWEEVREKLKSKEVEEKPPLSIVAHLQDRYELQDNDLLSNQGGEKSEGLANEGWLLKMFPDYVG